MRPELDRILAHLYSLAVLCCIILYDWILQPKYLHFRQQYTT